VVDSIVFTRCCDELVRTAGLDAASARSVLRAALHAAGLQPVGLSVPQLLVILRRVLPGELRACGVSDGEGVCAALAQGIGRIDETDGDTGEDAVAVAAAVFERFAPR